ncbi:MAG: hypothetical protein F4105_07455 [Gemmatimonadetes bacterium]|nr:hypothetical protein [Gemmatimonadota bacterium]
MRRILLAIGLLAALNGASVHSETMASSVESAQDQPSVAIITGEVQDPRSRKITFHYESPSALENSEQRVALDSLDRFAFELPVVRGTLVSGYFEDWQPRWKWVQWLDAFFSDPNSLTLFVEPGDSLHVVVKEGFFGRSYSFSGSNADNSRFTSKWIPQSRPLRLEYKGLEVEDFKSQMEQWRRDQFESLAAGREQYALSSGCIDYVTAYVNYEWANRMMSYPMNYRFANGRENRDITSEYHDFLQEFPLVDEKAIGVAQYRWFLERTLGWEEDHDHDDNPKLSKMYDLSGLELSAETQAQLDSLYEKSERSLKIYPLLSEEEKSPRADTTDGALVFYIPRGVRLDSLAKEPPKLSAKISLSHLGVSQAPQAHIE